MAKCKRCNTNLGFFSVETYCSNCKLELEMQNEAKNRIQAIQKQMLVLGKELAKKGKKLSYYLEIFDSLMGLQYEVESINEKFPDLLITSKTTDEIIESINEEILYFIEDRIEIIIEKNSIDNDIKKYNKELKKLFDEISECKVNYRQYAETLSVCQDKIKKHLKAILKSTS